MMGFKTGWLIAGLLLLALTIFSILWQIDGLVDTARQEAVKERNAYWMGQIAQSNALTQKARADQIEASAKADAAAQTQVDALNETLKTLEAANEAQPNSSDCGLFRARVRLLAN